MKSIFQAVLAVVSVFGVACGVGNSTLNLESNESALCSQGLLGQAINSTGKVPEGCVKIEGADIGRAPQTLEVDGVTVTITGWVEKSDSPGEYVGFTVAEEGGSVVYAVKASGRTFAGTDTTWSHPDGTSGSEASGISNITFCVEDDDGSTPGENGGGESGTDGGSGEIPGEIPGENGGGTTDAGTVTEGGGGGGECHGGGDDGDFNEGGGSGGAIDAGSPVITERGGAGSACSLNTECLSNVCNEGVCEQSAGGEACVAHTDCMGNYLCYEGVCHPDIQ